MKKSIYTFFLCSLNMFVLAQPQPGTIQQPTYSSLMIINNSSNTLRYDIRTHNYAENYLPICYTYIQELNPLSSDIYNNPTQVGVPLNLFNNGIVSATDPNYYPIPYIYLNTPILLYDFGTTQKWFEIKFSLLKSDLEGYLVPYFNRTMDGSYLLGGNFFKDENGIIWNSAGILGSDYSSIHNSSDGHSANWSLIGDINFVLIT